MEEAANQVQVLAANLGIITLLPLLGSAASYLAGRKNKDAAGWIATGASFASFLWVLKLFFALPEGALYEHKLFTWLSVGDFSVDYAFRFDHLSAVMCLVVTGIGSLIHLYSTAYMHEDEGRPRFFAYLNLFMFSMLTLVLAANLLVLFVGWEGVGLCSYLLIGFWFKNLSYAGAGRKAFVVNRIGDAGFLLAMFLMIRQFGSLDFMVLKNQILADPTMVGLYTAAAMLFFVGATGKSAQLPLFVWLPDAMAGPTPVSALIHAATMVTAGVYLLARMSFLFALAPAALAVVCVIALLTAFIAASTALVQNDIKKVLAYSTVSQLGFMFMAASAGAYWVAIFHVVTHAFFKACLFLGAGSVIHGCHHEQDMRHMGGLWKYMPITGTTYLLSVLAIAGIAPLSGYYSKHAILGALEHMSNPSLASFGEYVVPLTTLTAFLTAFYMTRSFAMTFLGSYRGHAHPHESPWQMTLPLIVLAFLAVIGGLWLHETLPHYLSSVMPIEASHGSETLLEALMHSWVGLLGVALALFVYTSLKDLPGRVYSASRGFGKLLSGKYFFDEFYAAVVVGPLERLAGVLWKTYDQGLVDGVVNGVGEFCEAGGEVARITQTGQVRHYALAIFLGTMLVIMFVSVR